jgi:proteasome component ECM29
MAEQPAPSTAPTAAAPEQTDAERLDALDRTLTRLALADDARLAPVLAPVLPYAITSLASPAPAVRKLVSAPPLPSPLPWALTGS